MAHVIDPGGMIDQIEEWSTQFDTVVNFEPGILGVITSLGVAQPLAHLEWREYVDGLVERVQELGFDGVLENQVSAQVEQEIVQCRWSLRLGHEYPVKGWRG